MERITIPAPDRHTTPLYVAAVASYQGWDAPMQFAYSQEPLNGPGSPSNWQSYNDPALLETLPAAALMFRRGDVAEAKTTYVLRYRRISYSIKQFLPKRQSPFAPRQPKDA